MTARQPLWRVQGLRRWTQWLTERLTAANVIIGDPGVFEDGASWRVQFVDGSTSQVLVDDEMLRARGDDFDRITRRLDKFGWIKMLRTSGAEGLHLSRWARD